MAHEKRTQSGPHAEVTEQGLVQRLQAGDAVAFDALFRQYFGKVLRQAMHFLENAAEAEAESVPGRVTCEQTTALLIDYVTGELDPTTTLMLEGHLVRCVDCVVFLRTYKETIRTTRTLRYDDMPGELQDRMLRMLHAKMRGGHLQ